VKILVVEDSKFLRVAVERALTKASYVVICASDGEEALRVAREALPDAILFGHAVAQTERTRSPEGLEERSCNGRDSRYCPQ
jgi:DNA-binding response OmpR family regulator